MLSLALLALSVGPYLQLVAPDSITVVWWSENDTLGTLEWGLSERYGEPVSSSPEAFHHVPGFRHEVRLAGLRPNTLYFYRVVQGQSVEAAYFTTAVELGTDFTFAVAADPESKATEPVRSVIHRAVLEQIATRDPRFLLYAGDLVDQGNAQDDWDAFWSDMNGFAATTPVYPALGNHDYDGLDTTLRGNRVPYAQPHAEDGVAKYRAYFSLPGNRHSSSDPRHERYYRLRYGPVSVIVLDTNNDARVDWDTGRYRSHSLVGENEPAEDGGKSWAPDIHEGSEQYQWLAETLEVAERESAFTLIVNHQAPYSSFVHGKPGEQQSGYPLRKLDGLFQRLGVDAVFSGHDESYERSVVGNFHYYVLPAIGDPTGLRDPVENPVWQEGFSRFIYPEGNRRHGYLGVAIEHRGGAAYRATLTPYYLDPDSPQNANRYYDDVTVLEGSIP